MTTTRTTRRTTEHKVEGELKVRDLYALIQAQVSDAPPDATIEVYFAVPGGGDWSNTNIDIDDGRHTVKFTVSWKETTK